MWRPHPACRCGRRGSRTGSHSDPGSRNHDRFPGRGYARPDGDRAGVGFPHGGGGGARLDGLTLSIKLIPYGGNKLLLISRDITHLERIETMRRDFVANVSHELRTPLTVVNGFVETLHDMPSLENSMARRALHLMGEQMYRMERLVDDLLTLSKLENTLNALQEETVDVPGLLRTLHQEGQSLSAGKHTLRLELASNCALLGNTDELRSAFGNLISNAIHYTPQGGEILVSWHEQNDQPVFSVQDSGIGIARTGVAWRQRWVKQRFFI